MRSESSDLRQVKATSQVGAVQNLFLRIDDAEYALLSARDDALGIVAPEALAENLKQQAALQEVLVDLVQGSLAHDFFAESLTELEQFGVPGADSSIEQLKGFIDQKVAENIPGEQGGWWKRYQNQLAEVQDKAGLPIKLAECSATLAADRVFYRLLTEDESHQLFENARRDFQQMKTDIAKLLGRDGSADAIDDAQILRARLAQKMKIDALMLDRLMGMISHERDVRITRSIGTYLDELRGTARAVPAPEVESAVEVVDDLSDSAEPDAPLVDASRGSSLAPAPPVVPPLDVRAAQLHASAPGSPHSTPRAQVYNLFPIEFYEQVGAAEKHEPAPEAFLSAPEVFAERKVKVFTQRLPFSQHRVAYDVDASSNDISIAIDSEEGAKFSSSEAKSHAEANAVLFSILQALALGKSEFDIKVASPEVAQQLDAYLAVIHEINADAITYLDGPTLLSQEPFQPKPRTSASVSDARKVIQAMCQIDNGGAIFAAGLGAENIQRFLRSSNSPRPPRRPSTFGSPMTSVVARRRSGQLSSPDDTSSENESEASLSSAEEVSSERESGASSIRIIRPGAGGGQ